MALYGFTPSLYVVMDIKEVCISMSFTVLEWSNIRPLDDRKHDRRKGVSWAPFYVEVCTGFVQNIVGVLWVYESIPCAREPLT